jgi:hypothetical protein
LDRQTDRFTNLLHQGSFANLARACHHLNEAAWLCQALDQYLKLGSLIGHIQITQLSE